MKKLTLCISLLLLSFVSLSQSPIRVNAASPIGATFDINVTSHFGASNTVPQTIQDRNYGSKLSIDPTSGSYPEYTFAFWIVNGVVRKDLAVNYQFTVTENLTLHAIFKPSGSYAVVFMDSNGKVIGDVQYVASGENATAPSSGLPTKVGYTYADPQWLGSYTNVTEDTAVILQYVLSNSSTYTVTFTNVANVGSDKSSYAYNEVATLTADASDGVNSFSHWAIGTHIISYDRVFKTTIVDNIYPRAVYLETPLTPAAIITISDALALRDGYVSYKGQFDLPSGFDLIEYGLLTSTTFVSSIDIDTATNKYKSEKYNGVTGEFVMSIATANAKTVRGYVIYNDGDSIEIAYSEISLANGKTISIYEVYGGGGNSGAIYKSDFITLYNASSKPVSLSGYSVQYASLTGTTYSVTNLTGSVQPYSYYLVKEADGAGAQPALPTPDATGTIAMSGTGAKVALVNTTTALSGAISLPHASVIDYVGWNTTASVYEGAGRAPATTNSTSIVRKIPGYDTDDNANDFISNSVTPRNSSYVPW